MSAEETRAGLLGLVDEALELQAQGLRVLQGVRDDESLTQLAPQAGAISGRLQNMRKEIPKTDDTQLSHCGDVLDAILNHHVWSLSTAVSLLSVSFMYENVDAQRRKTGDFGTAGQWLELLAVALRSGDLSAVDELPQIPRTPLSD